MTSEPYIFISYKSEEQRFALRLAADLQNKGVHIWLDKLNIQVSHLWGQEIDHALKSSSGVIVVMTPQYFQSQICKDELHYAYTSNLPIFPIMLRRVETGEQPFWLPARQYLNFTNWRSSTYVTVLDQLVTRIRTLQKKVISTPPDAESRYLNSLIAELETYQGVEEYVQLGGQSSHVSSIYGKRLAPGLSRLANLDTLDKEPLESLEQAKEKHSRFVLIGDPGSGKSTTLRHLALESARKRQTDSMQPLPVYLSLALWVNEKTPDDFIRAYLERAGLGPDVLATTQMELYLDGLNEIGSASEQRAQQLRQWLKANNKTSRVIISCRKANYVKALDLGIPTIVCEELDDNRIKQFVENYVAANSEQFLSLLYQSAQLKSDKNPQSNRSLLLLARNPYLLTALILVFQPSRTLPFNNGTLLATLVETLWEREVELNGEPFIEFEEAKQAYAQLAFAMIDEGKPTDVPLDFAKQYLGAGLILEAGRNASLLELSEGSIRFTHQLIQEYFAAVYMQQLDNVDRFIQPFALDYAHERIDKTHFNNGDWDIRMAANKWDQVLVALCGIAPDVQLVVQKMARVNPYLAVEAIRGRVNISQLVLDNIAENLFATMREKLVEIRRHIIALRQRTFEGRSTMWEDIADLSYEPFTIEFMTHTARIISDVGGISIPVLLRFVDDRSDDLRYVALEGLGQIRAQEAISKISEHLNDKGTVYFIGTIYYRMGTELPEGVGGGHYPLALAAVRALIKIGTPDAVKIVETWYWDGLVNNRLKYLTRIGKLGLPILLQFSESADLQLALNAVRVIGRLYGSIYEEIDHLQSHAATRAKAILEFIGWRYANNPTRPELFIDALASPDEIVRILALESIAAMFQLKGKIPVDKNESYDAFRNVLLSRIHTLSRTGKGGDAIQAQATLKVLEAFVI